MSGSKVEDEDMLRRPVALEVMSESFGYGCVAW